MQKTCANAWCNTSFKITPDDLAFYEKVSPVFGGKKYAIPPPTRCPDCRQQRRLAQCNEFHLYSGRCGLCSKDCITEHPPWAHQPIYCRECWYSDRWDPRDFGREFDFSRPFFEQLHELRRTVPAIALNQTGTIQNSDYIHYAGYSKNCYLIMHADFCEDCCYGYGYKKNTSCMDGFYNLHCELCYDNVYVHKSYGLIGCVDCVNCTSSTFLRDCIGCKNCFLCTGLRGREYCFENRKLSKGDYEAKMAEIDLGSHEQYHHFKQQLRVMEKNRIVKEYQGHNIQNCSGNYLQNCKNCHACFDIEDGEDLKHCYQLVLSAKSSRDIYQYGTKITACYECGIVGDDSYHILFSSQIFINCTDLLYCCFMANSCKSCFGCCNMVRSSHCILNKQYRKEEYEELAARIVEHMKETREWGEFLPVVTSLFGYNKSTAQRWYPLPKDEIERRAWNFDTYEPPPPDVEKIISAEQLPDSIEDIPDDILNWAIRCEVTGKPYRIQPLELRLLRKMRVPIPRRHPDQRHLDRFNLRNPRKLWKRECMKCGKEIQTTYQPSRLELVYCEKCYLETVY